MAEEFHFHSCQGSKRALCKVQACEKQLGPYAFSTIFRVHVNDRNKKANIHDMALNHQIDPASAAGVLAQLQVSGTDGNPTSSLIGRGYPLFT